ncbi:hypothetical protein FLAPXU55_03585 [Flavobacterium panici]|uniref:Uncharacterized protein n=1 Tax=Flavobacterium panici TaxID=2654843 RepID=A0A9N8J425_9FLAO|nr:hypothetical protein FLAPXU55_03585 [Flavobacterium panici]
MLFKLNAMLNNFLLKFRIRNINIETQNNKGYGN